MDCNQGDKSWLSRQIAGSWHMAMEPALDNWTDRSQLICNVWNGQYPTHVSICLFLDIWVWLLDHAHMFGGFGRWVETTVVMVGPYRERFLSWTYRRWSWDHIWMSPDQQWQIGDSYLHMFVSWTSGCDLEFMLTWFRLWLQSSVAIDHSYFCIFFVSWVSERDR